MKCKYCKEEIIFDGEYWLDSGRNLRKYCACDSDDIIFHAPEDSADELDQKWAEVYKTLDEIKRLTEQLKEGR